MLTLKWPGWSIYAGFYLGEKGRALRLRSAFKTTVLWFTRPTRTFFFVPKLSLKQNSVENEKHRQGHCLVQRLRHIGMTLLDSSRPGQTVQSPEQRAFLALSVCLPAGCLCYSPAHSFKSFLWGKQTTKGNLKKTMRLKGLNKRGFPTNILYLLMKL